ncbi:MAG: transposase [Proteobacteria bacterium]|nr:transposase [Pseudomonadota bacterium]
MSHTDMLTMTIARSQQISLEHTRYYHCISRCVRRAFLCGQDHYSGKDFGHRRQWLENRLSLLAGVFAIDLLAYAIMSNHYHVVLKVNIDQANAWSDEEVVERWGQLFRVPDAVDDVALIDEWRLRLYSISWFMRCLNEPLARWANKEDDCSGRFWEGRYKLQALLDDTALLRCMAYVDLNPIRAGIAKTPESSPHTSVYARIHRQDDHLAPLNASPELSNPIPISRDEYLRLIDWSGRALTSDKRHTIPDAIPPIFERLDFKQKHWLADMRHYGRWYYRAVGSLQTMERYCQHLGQQWLKGAKIDQTVATKA